MIFNVIGHSCQVFLQRESPLLFLASENKQKGGKYKKCMSILVYRESSYERNYVNHSKLVLIV
jgi:hypothetical protein